MTEDEFLKQVADHKMEVLLDNGVYRHLLFKKPKTSAYHFSLITFPGGLLYTGDMGNYVFKRLHDMFEFFRTDRQYRKYSGCKLAVNLSYWAEKVVAEDRHSKVKEWSSEYFYKRIRDDFKEWLDQQDLSDEDADDARKRLQEEVIEGIYDGDKSAAYQAAMSFQCCGRHPFEDWWEVDTDDYTYHFRWACYAIAWGIEQYDATQKTGFKLTS